MSKHVVITTPNSSTLRLPQTPKTNSSNLNSSRSDHSSSGKSQYTKNSLGIKSPLFLTPKGSRSGIKHHSQKNGGLYDHSRYPGVSDESGFHFFHIVKYIFFKLFFY